MAEGSPPPSYSPPPKPDYSNVQSAADVQRKAMDAAAAHVAAQQQRATEEAQRRAVAEAQARADEEARRNAK